MPKKHKKLPTLLMLPLAAALFLIGWIISFTGQNKSERNTKQTKPQNNKIQIGILLPEQQLTNPKTK